MLYKKQQTPMWDMTAFMFQLFQDLELLERWLKTKFVLDFSSKFDNQALLLQNICIMFQLWTWALTHIFCTQDIGIKQVPLILFGTRHKKLIYHLVLQITTKVITNCDRLTYYKLRQNPITNCDIWFVTNCDSYIKNCNRYYELR